MSDNRRRPKAEMPKRRPRVGGGTAEGRPHARQADTACDDHAGQPVLVTMEEVLGFVSAIHKVTEQVVGDRCVHATVLLRLDVQ